MHMKKAKDRKRRYIAGLRNFQYEAKRSCRTARCYVIYYDDGHITIKSREYKKPWHYGELLFNLG